MTKDDPNMRAAVIYEHGAPEVLKLEEDFPKPTAGPGEVILRVGASSLNYHDVFTRRGMPGIKVPMPMIMGIDVAGTVAELGEGVEGWKIGDRVLVDPVDREGKRGLMGEMVHGGLAEYCRAEAHSLVPVPDEVTLEQAAALPVAYGTAYRMMMVQGQIKKGERVLILGASGGVGTCCVQLAKSVGAEVVACASSQEKMDRLKDLGADDCINYVEEDIAKAVYSRYGKPHRHKPGNGVDVVINFTGGETWARCMRTLRPGGRILTCGATAGYDPKTDLRFIWTYELTIQGSNGWKREDLHKLLEMVAAGELTPMIDTVFPLEASNEALALIEDRKVFGKVVVTP
ncbi:quinone oxidoreductase family protein [Pseudooceanicola nanhaiensis]|uniref:quinone oxidoreductase family protein n=1 Tax=Pseudooceanicola nanhaiensis TaxID=375761 RepID=UPI001CD41967|nr:zinc-binding dehydrogenase [Pseudooceanicola nanhaiensis]MCA0921923.1 zinc-binding dehydrogenase [Pseudooceanicola nanhaiensis]